MSQFKMYKMFHFFAVFTIFSPFSKKCGKQDQEFVKNFADHIRKLYSMIPPGREKIIAEHACKKYSGRVGRSAAAKAYDEKAIDLAVIAHIRHTMTGYDEMLSKGYERFDARALVEDEVDRILEGWSGNF